MGRWLYYNKMSMRKLIITFLILSIVSSVAVSNPLNRAFAHTFSGDESATFLALIEMIKTDLGFALSRKLPVASDIVPLVEPFSVTDAPATGSFFGIFT